jgi:hypothetical protein
MRIATPFAVVPPMRALYLRYAARILKYRVGPRGTGTPIASNIGNRHHKYHLNRVEVHMALTFNNLCDDQCDASKNETFSILSQHTATTRRVLDAQYLA